MATKSTGKAKVESKVAEVRTRGQNESGLVSLTVRLPRDDWKRLHELTLEEGISIQTLAVRGFNLVFAEKGLRRLKAKS